MSLIRYYFRSYPRQSALTLVCLVAAAFAEGLGLASVVPLLAIAMGRDQVTESRGGQEVAELLEAALAWFGLPFSVVTVALVISVLIWLKAGLILLSMRQVGNTVAWIATDLRLELLRQLLDARPVAAEVGDDDPHGRREPGRVDAHRHRGQWRDMGHLRAAGGRRAGGGEARAGVPRAQRQGARVLQR